jgi:mannose-1-phosphate guanylyltransferase
LQVPKETTNRYGCLVADPKTSEVLHYVEKPETFVSDLISCGVYVFEQGIFKDIEAVVRDCQTRAIQTANESVTEDVIRLEQDILHPLAGTGRLFVYQTNEFWRQIKTAG